VPGVEKTTRIAIFKGKKIRKTIHKNEWWFSVIDVIETLTETERPRKYWNDLKIKLIKKVILSCPKKSDNWNLIEY